MTIDRATLRNSWHSWIAADIRRAGPYWLQLLWTALFAVVLAVVFTVLGFVAWADEARNWLDLPRWRYWLGKNLVVTAVIAFLIHGLFEGIGRLIGGPARIRRFTPPQRALFFAGIPFVGVAAGAPLALWLVGARRMAWFAADDGLRAIVVSVAFWVLASFVLYEWFSIKTRAIIAERERTEAQLRLLQAQIEPHFLFNTLANVLSLIDHDAPKAKAMLHAFTEYLRSALTDLRRHEGPLDLELALAGHYLQLQAARMDERLRYTIEADAAARRVLLPPLLLQPLVENAVTHGLEPTIAGGRVDVCARLHGHELVIEVRDDGRGPDAAPRRAARTGSGVALANIRQRLLARYGGAAALEVQPAHPGTLARLTIPIEAAP